LPPAVAPLAVAVAPLAVAVAPGRPHRDIVSDSSWAAMLWRDAAAARATPTTR